MQLRPLFGRRSGRIDSARAIYAVVVRQARSPAFYRDLGVPDTVDGRFELVVLHAFLVLRRLKGEPAPAPEVAQALFDVMFDDMDAGLREMGAGDMGVGKRVKAMAEAFYGRIASYDAALGEAGGRLREALERNLYGTLAAKPAAAEALAGYVRSQARRLGALDADAVLAARFAFGEIGR